MTAGVVVAPVEVPDTGFRCIGTRSETSAPGRRVPVIVVAGGMPAALLDVDAPAAPWRVFRFGATPGQRAYLPGRREAHPLAGPAQRPPRRIEIRHPAPLLREMTLLEAPPLSAEPAAVELLLDAAARAAGLVVAVDALRPPGPAELRALSAAAGRLRRVAFLLSIPRAYPRRSEIVREWRAALRTHGPRLARAPWLVIEAAGAPAGRADAAAIRALLSGWSTPEPEARTAVRSSAVPVAPLDDRWRTVLDREVRNRRIAAGQLLAIDVATSHVRCVQELGSGGGCAALPDVLDRELHALSVRATRQLDSDTTAVLGHVLAALVDGAPDSYGEAVLDRVRVAVRRTLETLPSADEQALLLTTTSGVAVVSGPGAVASLSSTGLPEPPDAVFAPIGIGLTASCYQLWQAPGRERSAARRWVQQALRVVESELHRELAQRYADLHQALAIIAADAVDHGVLLT